MSKIVFTSYDRLGNIFYGGGGAIAIHEVARQLAKHHSVCVLSAPANPETKPEETVDGVVYKTISLTSSQPQLSQLAYLFALPSAIKRQAGDIVFESFTPPWSVMNLPSYTDKPVVGVCHLLCGEIMANKYHFPLFKPLEKMILQRYQNIIALTEQAKVKLHTINPEAKICVIPNGVNIPAITKEATRCNYLYLGRIEMRQKGLEQIIHAFEIAARFNNWNLIIAGSGPKHEKEQLKEIIAQSKVAKRIQVLGYVQGKQKENLLLSAGSMIMASKYESQPLTMLEAMAYHCPLIISNITELKWISCDHAWKFNGGVAELARAMIDVYSSREVKQTKVTSAFNYVRGMSWDKTTQSYEKLIQRLI